jgi:hypothetical protein
MNILVNGAMNTKNVKHVQSILTYEKSNRSSW